MRLTVIIQFLQSQGPENRGSESCRYEFDNKLPQSFIGHGIVFNHSVSLTFFDKTFIF